MDACISNNFIFIIFMIVKNSHKVERSEKELTDSIRRFIYSEMASFQFFEWSEIDPVCVTDSVRAVWKRSLYITKIFSQWHLLAKCQHGHILQNGVSIFARKLYK